MKRFKLIFLCAICATAAIPMLCAMLAQAVIGSESRARAMAVALDQCGNALFGGGEDETISGRTGRALLAGKAWARVVAPCIDFFFGKGHCVGAIGE